MFGYLSLVSLHLVILSGDVLSNSSVKPRIKRASSAQSSKLSVRDLLLGLAEKLEDKTKNSIDDHCTNIKAIGKPVVHNTRYYVGGTWMKDPLGIMGTDTIFVMGNYESSNVVQEYENMNTFKAGVARKTYNLPYQWDGPGAVVYGPYLYYNRANSKYIHKYNLQTRREEAAISVDWYAPRVNSYDVGGYSGIDLAVDEHGLWALHGGLKKNSPLHASKIDVSTNKITKTLSFKTEPMNVMGNAFVACGVIYTVSSPFAYTTSLNFAYDSKTRKEWNPKIPFTNPYGTNFMVDYNPREKRLYAWSMRYLLTYPITFE